MPQNFSGHNLRGRSFKGQDLTGANFYGAVIRGADFTNAKLISANFSYAEAGLQGRWAIVLLVVSLFLSILSGFISAPAGSITGATLISKDPNYVFNGAVILITLAVFFIVTIRQGLVTALGVGGMAGAVVGVVAVAGAFAFAVAGAGAGVVALAGAGALAFAAAGAGALAFATAVAGALAVAGTVAGTVVAVAAAAFAVTMAVAALGPAAGALAGAVARTGNVAFAFALAGAGNVAVAGVVTLAGAGLSAYVARRALAEDEKFALTRSLAVSFAAIGGTSFRGADLTNADFTSATLKSTDFRSAILTRTSWKQAKKLDRVRPGTTYLRNAQLRQWLIGNGLDKNFDRQDLRGVNLKGANLADASFIGADLSKANLQDADLSRAKLVQTRLDETDLTGATLTGACIEDWGITSHTKLDGVRCEYVFMRLETQDDPNRRRKPDNWNETFQSGDFADFIKPIADTLDLYHNQDVDPRAIAISFKQLAENHPDAELEIVAMEKRGRDKFLLRAKTALDADHSALSAEYFDTYNQLKALAEQEVQKILAEKDDRIHSLETMVVTALQRPNFYTGTYHNQGDTMSQAPKKVSNFDLKSAQFAGGLVDAETVHANQIGGNIHNYAQQQNLVEAAAEIQQLLQQLEQTYPTNTPLEKQMVVTEALKQIESNPTLKARVIGALKAGGTEALRELVDHPLVNILLAALEGWQEP